MSGLECQISDFGFRVSGFGFRVSGCRFSVAGFGFLLGRTHKVARSREHTPLKVGTLQVPQIEYPVPYFGYPVSDLGFTVSGFGVLLFFCITLKPRVE